MEATVSSPAPSRLSWQGASTLIYTNACNGSSSGPSFSYQLLKRDPLARRCKQHKRQRHQLLDIRDGNTGQCLWNFSSPCQNAAREKSGSSLYRLQTLSRFLAEGCFPFRLQSDESQVALGKGLVQSKRLKHVTKGFLQGDDCRCQNGTDGEKRQVSAGAFGRLQTLMDLSRPAEGSAKEKRESRPKEPEVEVDLDELMSQGPGGGSIGTGWLPPAPEIARPRARFNAATMAYLGDGVYQLYAKRHFLLPPKSVNTLNEKVLGLVRCETQAAMLRKLSEGRFLTKEERDVVRWGKNAAQDSSRKAIRRAGGIAYGQATALETLIGFLYLTDPARLDALMTHIGFGFDSSTIVTESPEPASEPPALAEAPGEIEEPEDVPGSASPGHSSPPPGHSSSFPGPSSPSPGHSSPSPGHSSSPPGHSSSSPGHSASCPWHSSPSSGPSSPFSGHSLPHPGHGASSPGQSSPSPEPGASSLGQPSPSSEPDASSPGQSSPSPEPGASSPGRGSPSPGHGSREEEVSRSFYAVASALESVPDGQDGPGVSYRGLASSGRVTGSTSTGHETGDSSSDGDVSRQATSASASCRERNSSDGALGPGDSVLGAREPGCSRAEPSSSGEEPGSSRQEPGTSRREPGVSTEDAETLGIDRGPSTSQICERVEARSAYGRYSYGGDLDRSRESEPGPSERLGIAPTGGRATQGRAAKGARRVATECSPEVRAVWDKTKIMLWQRYRLGTTLSPEDRDYILKEVLAFHPDAQRKVGCGVESITVNFSVQTKSNRCFYVVRTDGTQEDFSYLKCLRVRRGILPQISAASLDLITGQHLGSAG